MQRHIKLLPKFLRKQLRKIYAKQLLKVKANRNDIYKLNYEIMRCQNRFIVFIMGIVISLLLILFSFKSLYYISLLIIIFLEIRWLIQDSYVEDLVKYSKVK